MKPMPTHLRLLSLLFLLVFSTDGRDAVTPNPLFSDNAVLQEETPIPVWGVAKEGEKISVTLDGQSASTTAKDGKWKLMLPAHKAGGPYDLTISGENTNTITNVLVGEVWVCSGQSNMEFPLSRVTNAAAEIASASYPMLRMFSVARRISANPQEEVVGKWAVCTPAAAPGFSAIGYFFGHDLVKARSVPIGMIHSSWGGTPAQAWTSFSGLSKDPSLKVYVDQLRNAVVDFMKNLEAYRTALAGYHPNPAGVSSGPPWPADLPPSGPRSPFESNGLPTILYNGMIAPLQPYAIRGVIWYQGEANNGQAKLYQTLFPAMIADWREKWGRGDFPFLFTQIAPFTGMSPEIREAQFLTLGKSTNTAMAVTTDVGNAADIHPTQKEPVGQRLALAARALAYGEKIEYSGPLYQSLKIEGSNAVVLFTHTGSGLMAKDGDLRGFTIGGTNGQFLPAKAAIAGETVVVSAAEVTAPTAVRYGWTNVPDVNLWNKEGLPASPFRTDSAP